MTTTDLQLQYVVTNKEAVTKEIIEALVLRAFAYHFRDYEATAGVIIARLSDCLCTMRLDEVSEANEDREDNEDEVEAQILRGAAANKCYRDEIIRLYLERGFDQLYAEEAAEWPDVLQMDADYLKETLHKMAEIEVGHDLIMGEYLRATAHLHAAENKRGRTE